MILWDGRFIRRGRGRSYIRLRIVVPTYAGRIDRLCAAACKILLSDEGAVPAV